MYFSYYLSNSHCTVLSFTMLILFEYTQTAMSSSTKRQQERDEYSSNAQHRQQHEAAIRSIDETKEGIRRSIEEVRREMPRYSQTVTDFQNETADASMEIANNFLEFQKEVINSLQSAWAPMAERTGGGGHYWTTGMIEMLLSPRGMADIYTKTIGVMTEAYVASTHMATNMMFAGMEAARATTNYARQNAREAARITSNTARTFAPAAAKETVQVEGEEGTGGTDQASPSLGSRAAATTTMTANYTSEDPAASRGETASSTAGTGAATETTTGLTEKTRKK
jgi:hypothetical protein